MEDRREGLMRWNEVEQNWDEVADNIAAILPRTDAGYLADVGPDAERVISHIAERHDLTRTEARETLEERVLTHPLTKMRFAAE